MEKIILPIIRRGGKFFISFKEGSLLTVFGPGGKEEIWEVVKKSPPISISPLREGESLLEFEERQVLLKIPIAAIGTREEKRKR